MLRTETRNDGSKQKVEVIAWDNETEWAVIGDDKTDSIRIEKAVDNARYILFMEPDEWELVQDMVKTAEGMIDRRAR